MDKAVNPLISASSEACCCCLLSDCVNNLPGRPSCILLFHQFWLFGRKEQLSKDHLETSCFLCSYASLLLNFCKSTLIFRTSKKDPVQIFLIHVQIFLASPTPEFDEYYVNCNEKLVFLPLILRIHLMRSDYAKRVAAQFTWLLRQILIIIWNTNIEVNRPIYQYTAAFSQ